MKPELERDPIWRTIPCVKEILVQKGIAARAPWENIQGGTEILESLGYTEYTGFALQFPRNIIPDMFADHIGNLTVELVLASAEVKRETFRPILNILLLQGDHLGEKKASIAQHSQSIARSSTFPRTGARK